MAMPTRRCQESIGSRLLGKRSRANKQTSIGCRTPVPHHCPPVVGDQHRSVAATDQPYRPPAIGPHRPFRGAPLSILTQELFVCKRSLQMKRESHLPTKASTY
jgi:hypothetical protein